MDALDHTDKDNQISFQDDGAIVVPAVACNMPDKQNRSIIFMKSFLGGKQLHIQDDHELEYTLKFNPQETTRKEYQLSLKVVTVHDKMSPLLLTIATQHADKDKNVCKEEASTAGIDIAIPYTKGEFQMTTPVIVSLLGNSSSVLTFKRKTADYGLTIKEILLTPMNTSTVADSTVKSVA
jgi:hypothetical protein